MEVLYARCAGLDVHKKTVVACRLFTLESGRKQQEVRTFGTTTGELLRLLDWLREGGCTHVAMESTGEYWKPVYNLLEGQAELLLVNPQHCKNVPGRKTDVKDAEWLADLLRHGLLKASFVPPRPQRELRDLTRGRCNPAAWSTGCRRCWKTRTSSWAMWPATSPGSRAGRCSPPFPRVRPIRKRWPTWRGECCGRSEPPWPKR